MHTFRDFLVVGVFPEDAVDYSLWVAWASAVFAVSVGGFGAGPDPTICVFGDFAVDAGEF